MFNIVLINPEIPQNTGNVARSVISQKCALHLVKPIGFRIDDSSLKRAGLDYWQFVDLKVWESTDEFFMSNDIERMHFFSKKGAVRYDQADYSKGDFLVFGPESTGLDSQTLAKYLNKTRYIPMPDERVRSINLSSAVSVALFEAMRQNGFFNKNA